MKMKLFVGMIGLTALGSGCLTAAMQADAARVRTVQPRPLVDLPERDFEMEFEADPSVPDTFVVPEQNGVTSVPVEGWRASLENGFRNGPGRFFKAGSPPAWRFVVLSAELDYVPTAMFARGTQITGAATVQARLRYIARVVGPDGQVKGRDQGEVFSTSHWTEAGGSSTTAAEAIAAMYQNASKQIIAATGQ